MKNKSIYIISGPCGVGKSTITKALAQEMEKAVLIEGDVISAMFNDEAELPWEEKLSIVWKNIISLTKNFIEHNLNVIIDYVVEEELEMFCKQLSSFNVNIHYVVLRADKDILIKRLQKRGDEDLITRSLFLLDKLENSFSNKQFLYDTTNKQPIEIKRDIRYHFEQFKL